MTVGGKTKGRATTAPTGPFQREAVCASHHASGVHRTSSKKVVTEANSNVNVTAAQSSVDKMPKVLKRISELLAQ